MSGGVPRDALAWLRSRPPLDALREHYPDLWSEVEQELGEAVAGQNHAGLHALLNPAEIPERAGKARASLRQQTQVVRSAIKQRMTALALERHSLAIATGQKRGKVRFNLINGLIALQQKVDGESRKTVRWYQKGPVEAIPVPILGPDLIDVRKTALIKQLSQPEEPAAAADAGTEGGAA